MQKPTCHRERIYSERETWLRSRISRDHEHTLIFFAERRISYLLFRRSRARGDLFFFFFTCARCFCNFRTARRLRWAFFSQNLLFRFEIVYVGCGDKVERKRTYIVLCKWIGVITEKMHNYAEEDSAFTLSIHYFRFWDLPRVVVISIASVQVNILNERFE